MKKMRTFNVIAINVVVTLLFLVMLEGGASLILAVRDSKSVDAPFVAETKHTRFDALLGWVNEPNITVENMYGEGVYLSTNDKAFRSDNSVSVEKQPGVKRILCVGDSFTLGYGVSNNQTWCHFLSEILPHVETVNMGQGGYGIDQAYLWYKRDGVKLDHDLVVFAFITSDFYRMQLQSFSGFSKPYLFLDDGYLRVIPPEKSEDQVEGTSFIGSFLSNLRIAQFLEKLRWKLKLMGSSDGVLSPEATMVTAALIEDMKKLTKDSKAELLLVHLPNADDHPVNAKTDGLRITLKQIAEEKKICYIDIVESLQSLPSSFDAQLLFQYGNQHFNIEGNQFVAQRLKAEIEQRLSQGEQFTSKY